MSLSTAVDVSAVARVVGIKTAFKDLRGGSIVYLPQRIALIGQGATASVYSTVKAQYTSALAVAQAYGFGSPVHLAAKQLLPANGDGIGTIPLTVYPLDDDGAGVASAGIITPTIAPTEAASYIVRINNIDSEAFTILTTDTVATVTVKMAAAINAILDMPVTASSTALVVDTVAKWEGVSSNDIFIEVIGSTTSGNSFAITQHVGGLVNPDVTTATDQVGDVWETMVLNCMEIGDTTTLDLFSVFGEGRWGALVRKPLIVFTGNTEPVVATAVVVSDARTTDRVNAQLVAPGSNDLPFVVAARQLARIAVVANNNPPRDYGSQPATGLVPGTDGEQWTYADRDVAVKAGSSTTEVKDGVINVSDTVTFYHPAGDPTPAYRFVVDIVKIQNILFNLNLEFATAKWDGAPLIPDDQPTTNASAKKPKMAVAAVSAIIDSLGLNAFISDPETAKANTFAEIDAINPKRLNVVTTIQLSGNSNIISVDFNFGFYFGTPAVVA
jgi:phage tail sheath gpL-like